MHAPSSTVTVQRFRMPTDAPNGECTNNSNRMPSPGHFTVPAVTRSCPLYLIIITNTPEFALIVIIRPTLIPKTPDSRRHSVDALFQVVLAATSRILSWCCLTGLPRVPNAGLILFRGFKQDLRYRCKPPLRQVRRQTRQAILILIASKRAVDKTHWWRAR
jgi:hypothetical protein